VSRGRQGRLVVLVNGVLSVVIVALIAAVSVFRQQVRPPGIEEFAPAAGRPFAAVQPSTPTCTRGSACLGHLHVRDHAERLAVPAGARGVPSALACFGWPDGTTTQTFDPQSPPCIAGWVTTRGNGGASVRGVTATAIRVGVPRSSVSGLSAYATFFSTHFQLYGRSIQLVPLGPLDLRTPEGQQSAALQADQEQVFATLPDLTPSSGPATVPTDFLNAATSRGLVSLLSTPSQISTTALSGLSPYVWSYPSGFDQLQRATANLFCNQLAGRQTSFAAAYTKHTRRLAVLVPDPAHNDGSDLVIGALTDGLATCHTQPLVRNYDPTSAGALSDAMVELKSSGVTTVIPFATAGTLAQRLMPAAERTGYRPEWLLPGIDEDPATEVWQTAPARQMRGVFGLAGWSRQLGSGQQPDAEALRAVQPMATPAAGDAAVYHDLLMLASGAQLAGPKLTASSFADGLSTTPFANPGAGEAPSYQAAVGFDDGDHAMVSDIGLTWWNGDTNGFCLVGDGTRWGFADLPANDPGFFDRTRGC
jgi:hypothetical protein